MAGINNINGLYNINHKKISSKLSFDVGQVFSARVIDSDKAKLEILLKLLDGWQFPAKLKNPLNFIPDGLLRFQVEGFEDGKLQIKIVSSKDDAEEKEKSSIESLLEEENLGVDKDDYDILKSMIKHSMPLTKENISRVKTALDFKDKLNSDDSEEENFINKYISNRGIDANSKKADEIKQTLKGFFSEFKKLSTDDLLTLFENNIELSEENIKSFNKLVKEDNTISNDLNELEENILPEKAVPNTDGAIEKKPLGDLQAEKSLPNSNSSVADSEPDGFVSKKNIDKTSEDLPLNFSFKDIERKDKEPLPKVLFNILTSNNDEVNKGDKLKTVLDIIKVLQEKNPEDKEINKIMDTLKQLEGKQEETGEANANASVSASAKDPGLKLDKSLLKNLFSTINKDGVETSELVKQQINSKTEEMKNVIKSLLGEKTNIEEGSFDKIINTLKENLNDFKVFNSLSNQYYYLDVPVEMRNNQYQCKLMIKDDRKSGKKLDSKNIKMVVSVKTANLGVIDAYIKVSKTNMNIDIKCEKEWVKLLELGKEKVVNELSNLGYNVQVAVDKKVQDANLVNSREFFEDYSLGSLNVKV